METVFGIFKTALGNQDGYQLASTLSPVAPADHPTRLSSFYRDSSSSKIQTDVRYAIVYDSDVKLTKAEKNAWCEIYVLYWKAVGEILAAEESSSQDRDNASGWAKAYEAWREYTFNLIRGYKTGNLEAWTIPCLYLAGKHLRLFAIKADEQAERLKGSDSFNANLHEDAVGALGKHEKLEDAARELNKLFNLCSSDRAPLISSRKWGLYYIVNLLFKTYFKLNTIGLCKNILQSLHAIAADMPPLENFPASHQVTFNFYSGLVFFLEEDYSKAEGLLTSAYKLCHKDSPRNRERILTYLIPCHLLTTHTLPSKALLAPYPRLQALFTPFSIAIRRGDLAAFDAALAAGETEYAKRRIYLTLERGRDIAVRNLFRKTFMAGGYDPPKEGQSDETRIRRTRVPVDEFAAAVRLSMRGRGSEDGVPNGGAGVDQVIEKDEVECLLANMIYKNLMKGYISRERSMVVLSKGGAFPGTGV